MYVCMYVYIYVNKYVPLPEVEHFSEGINDCHQRNVKLFQRIEHSGIRWH